MLIVLLIPPVALCCLHPKPHSHTPLEVHLVRTTAVHVLGVTYHSSLECRTKLLPHCTFHSRRLFFALCRASSTLLHTIRTAVLLSVQQYRFQLNSRLLVSGPTYHTRTAPAYHTAIYPAGYSYSSPSDSSESMEDPSYNIILYRSLHTAYGSYDGIVILQLYPVNCHGFQVQQ